jgi:putative molybdopterin biosynthesis protein
MGNRIKEYREAKGLKQVDLARKLGMDRSHINRIENGAQTPTLALALRIANALDCNIQDIFFGSVVAPEVNKEED